MTDEALAPIEWEELLNTIERKAISIDDLLSTMKSQDENAFAGMLMVFYKRQCMGETITLSRFLRFVGTLVSSIDTQINQQVNVIIHHPRFLSLESTWRGARYLVDQTEDSNLSSESDVKIKLLDIRWLEAAKDITRAIDFDQSDLFRKIYSQEFDLPGGEPYGIIIADYDISHRPRPGVNDIDVLQGLAQIAAAAFSPILIGAGESLFGVEDYNELHPTTQLQNHFKAPEYNSWRSLRAYDDARFLGVFLPHILMRPRYRDDGSRHNGFRFSEQIRSGKDYCWGKASYGFAAVVMRAHARYGWYADIRGMERGALSFGVIDAPGKDSFLTDPKDYNPMPSANARIALSVEQDLHSLGFIPAVTTKNTSLLSYPGNYSLLDPKKYEGDAANANSKLSTMLQYMLCVSRFAHYVKVIVRDRVGSYMTAEQIEQYIREWLLKYTVANEDADIDIKARFPLREVEVNVKELVGQAGKYSCVLHLRPHYQLDDVVSSVKLRTQLNTVGDSI